MKCYGFKKVFPCSDMPGIRLVRMRQQKKASHLLRFPFLILAVAAGLIAGTSPAARATFLEVSPARIEAAVRDGAALPPIYVRNRGAIPVDLRISVMEGRHDQDGVPILDEPPPNERRSSPAQDPLATLDVFPRELRIPAGGVATLHAVVRATPRGSGGAYPMILIEAEPSYPDKSKVNTYSRIVVITLLRFPWASGGRGILEDMRVERAPGRDLLRFSFTFRNTGDIHVVPSGLIDIKDEMGNRVLTVPVKTGTVLPGMVRRFVAELRNPPIPAGRYMALASFAADGFPAGTKTLTFLIDDDNKLAKAGVK